jgi:hypothetical protein
VEAVAVVSDEVSAVGFAEQAVSIEPPTVDPTVINPIDFKKS